MTLDPGGMGSRKRRHIDVCLSEAVELSSRRHHGAGAPTACCSAR